MARNIVNDAGETIDLNLEMANQFDTTANARRILLVDSSGNKNATNYPLIVKISDGTFLATVDSKGFLVGINVAHHRVHSELMYITTDIDTDVDTISPKYWHIVAPDSATRIHLTLMISVDTAGLVEFYEAPTTSANGTEITARNADRNSANTAACKFYFDPTVSADGIALQKDRIGSTNNKTKIGGIARQQVEFILKQNTAYLVKYTPDSNDAKVTFNCESYEV